MTANPSDDTTTATSSSVDPELAEFNRYLAKQKDASPNVGCTPPSQATPDQVEKVLKNIAEIKKVPFDKENRYKALASTCELLQIGGASTKFDRNIPSTVVNDFTINMGDVNTAIKKVDPHLTPRKLARALQKEIHAVANTWGIPGNLSKAYSMDYPNASTNELICASDFFTFSKETNITIPDTVKQWLVDNYNTRWGNKKPTTK